MRKRFFLPSIGRRLNLSGQQAYSTLLNGSRQSLDPSSPELPRNQRRFSSVVRPSIVESTNKTASDADATTTSSETSESTENREEEHEVSSRHVSSVKVKFHPNNINTFSDLPLQPVILKSLEKHFPEITSPTTIQKRTLSLLSSDFSVYVASPPGSGKSLSIALYLASFPRDHLIREPHTTSLLLVPNSDAAKSYYKIFQKLYQDSPLNINQTVQVLYRTGHDKEEDIRQQNLLKQHPGPHILITTASRALDILSLEGERRLLPLYNLSCIALDEIDLSKAADAANTLGKKSAKMTPYETLLSHLYYWRNAYVKGTHDATFSPLRFVVASSTRKEIGGYLKNAEWTQGRPILKVASSADGFISKPKLYLVQAHEDAQEISDMSLEPSDKYNYTFRGLSVRQKKRAALDYGYAISRILGPDEKALVIVCESLSLQQLESVLRDEHSILSVKPVSDHYAFTSLTGDNETIEPEEFFKESVTTDTGPRVLITRTKNILGTGAFDGAKKVFLLWHEGETGPLLDMPKLNLLYQGNVQIYAVCINTKRQNTLVVRNPDIGDMLETYDIPISELNLTARPTMRTNIVHK